MSLKTVDPGNVIASADWNDLVKAINLLESRVSILEAGGGAKSIPKITQILPTGAVTAGSQIRIYGADFGYSQGAQSVYFGSTRATNFISGSSDSLLIVQIPNVVEGASEAGTAMTMSVGNLFGYATWSITVKAMPTVTSGGFQLSYHGSRPTTPTQNAPVYYDFDLESDASEDLTITLVPGINVIPPLPAGVTDPGLASLLEVIDSDGSVRGDHTIALAEGATKRISLRLNLPDQVDGLRYSLRVLASAPGVPSRIESLPDQQVGQAGEQPDATVTSFEYASTVIGEAVFSTDTGGVAGVDGTLTVKQGTTVTIQMATTFVVPVGTTYSYQMTAPVQAPANGWSGQANDILENPLPVQGPGGSVDTYFDITAPASSSTGVVRLTLTRQGATSGNTKAVSYRLVTTP
jgi:hypothetical protein